MVTSEGMVVRKGSKIATSEVPSMPQTFHLKREKLMSDGVVKDFAFTKDYLFFKSIHSGGSGDGTQCQWLDRMET